MVHCGLQACFVSSRAQLGSLDFSQIRFTWSPEKMRTSEPDSIGPTLEHGVLPCAEFIDHTRPLEGFQQVMLRWEEIRPYNAVHIIELNDLSLSAVRLSKSVAAVFSAVGLTSVRFNRSRKAVQYRSVGHPLKIAEVELQTASNEELSGLMTDKLSDFFAANEDSPFRITLARQTRANGVSATQYLVIGYRHAIADAQSIVLLVKAILDHYRDGLVKPPSLTCNAAGLRDTFRRDTSWETAIPRLGKLSLELLQGLRCHRPKSSDLSSTFETCKVHCADIETAKLKAAAKRHHASVQNFLMAAQAEAIAEVFGKSPARRITANQRLAVTAMLDLRRYADGKLDNAIGQFLGMLAVRPKVQATSDFSSLIEFVKSQNERSKQRREIFWAINSMLLMVRIWDAMPLSVNRDLARKLYPFVCALSNVNLAAPVDREIDDGVITNYFRGANLGVLVPLVLSNTTVGSKVNLCTTRKDAVYSESEVDQFIDCISRRIERS